jgi:hypothetical protein
MGSSRPLLGCAVVNTEPVPGCSAKGKTIANFLAVVFLFDL